MTHKLQHIRRPPSFSLLMTIAFVTILMIAAMSAFQLMEAMIG